MNYTLELVIVPVSDVDRAKAVNLRHLRDGAWTDGPHPERADYNTFAEFRDPDGNLWLLQERGHA